MDATRFDSLLKSLCETPSRRHALCLLIGAVFSGRVALGAGDVAAHDALLTCKKLKGDKKKKCLKRAKRHMKTHAVPPSPDCIPNCAGDPCGPDGCGGLCRSCTGGQECTATGVCSCGTGRFFCRGRCVGPCDPGKGHDDYHCGCCDPHGTRYEFEDDCTSCCSNKCFPTGDGVECEGLAPNDKCLFNAQCESNKCDIFALDSTGDRFCS